MSFDYAKPANTALKLLERFGRTIQHVSVIEGVYDPATTTSTDTTITTDVIGADFAVKDNNYKSELVQAGDRYCLIGRGVDIDVSDKIIIDGVTWNIYRVEKLAPAGIVVLLKVYIRK